MTLYQFNKMTPQSQITALKMFGAFAASRTVDKDWFLLFQIDAFYVEVLYNRSDSSSEIVRCFKSTNKLKSYLDEINLEALLSDL